MGLKILNFKDSAWEDAPRGYYLSDVKQKTLWEDKKTGALMVLLKFPPGVADKIHSHPEANQIAIGLTGEVLMPDGRVNPVEPNLGVCIDKATKHGATEFTKETIGLFFWDGPPRPIFDE